MTFLFLICEKSNHNQYWHAKEVTDHIYFRKHRLHILMFQIFLGDGLFCLISDLRYTSCAESSSTTHVISCSARSVSVKALHGTINYSVFYISGIYSVLKFDGSDRTNICTSLQTFNFSMLAKKTTVLRKSNVTIEHVTQLSLLHKRISNMVCVTSWIHKILSLLVLLTVQ